MGQQPWSHHGTPCCPDLCTGIIPGLPEREIQLRGASGAKCLYQQPATLCRYYPVSTGGTNTTQQRKRCDVHSDHRAGTGGYLLVLPAVFQQPEVDNRPQEIDKHVFDIFIGNHRDWCNTGYTHRVIYLQQ